MHVVGKISASGSCFLDTAGQTSSGEAPCFRMVSVGNASEQYFVFDPARPNDKFRLDATVRDDRKALTFKAPGSPPSGFTSCVAIRSVSEGWIIEPAWIRLP
jgi:hypothetical protein